MSAWFAAVIRSYADAPATAKAKPQPAAATPAASTATAPASAKPAAAATTAGGAPVAPGTEIQPAAGGKKGASKLPEKKSERKKYMWAVHGEELKRKKRRIKWPKRGWQHRDLGYLYIPDVIDFCINTKKLHQPPVYEAFMHCWRYLLKPKMILYCWQLNDIPYGRGWRKLGLTKGFYTFLEKVREGKLDDILKELAALKPRPPPAPVEEGKERKKLFKARRNWEKRTKEVRKKIKEHKQKRAKESQEAEKKKIREAEEALVKACTPEWLIRLQKEKEAKAAAKAQQGGGVGKRK